MKGGFRACGIFPFNPDAISQTKLAISIPFSTVPESSGSNTSPDSQSGVAGAPNGVERIEEKGECESIKATTTTVLDLKCTDCGRCITPIRMHVVAYFAKHLQKEKRKQCKDTRRIKPRYYGEVLTRDEIIERMEKEEMEKKKKKRKRVTEKAPEEPEANHDTEANNAASDGEICRALLQV